MFEGGNWHALKPSLKLSIKTRGSNISATCNRKEFKEHSEIRVKGEFLYLPKKIHESSLTTT